MNSIVSVARDRSFQWDGSTERDQRGPGATRTRLVSMVAGPGDIRAAKFNLITRETRARVLQSSGSTGRHHRGPETTSVLVASGMVGIGRYGDDHGNQKRQWLPFARCRRDHHGSWFPVLIVTPGLWCRLVRPWSLVVSEERVVREELDVFDGRVFRESLYVASSNSGHNCPFRRCRIWARWFCRCIQLP